MQPQQGPGLDVTDGRPCLRPFIEQALLDEIELYCSYLEADIKYRLQKKQILRPIDQLEARRKQTKSREVTNEIGL